MTKSDELRRSAVTFFVAGHTADYTVSSFAQLGMQFSQSSLYRWTEQMRRSGSCVAERSRTEADVIMDPLHFEFIEELLHVIRNYHFVILYMHFCHCLHL